MDSPLDELGLFIKEQRERARMSLRSFAKIAGVSNPYLSQIERGLRKPSADILKQIAKALKISAEILYLRAGILELEDEDVVAHILKDKKLTEEQKSNLINLYRSYISTSDGEGP
jgi:transcriptional regulator with XRE-family HTH domain